MKANEIHDRRKMITELLYKEDFVKTADLMERFNVSKETIRKDLVFLENEGMLKKKYGGAELISKRELLSKKELDHVMKRSPREFDKKERIVQAALKQLPLDTKSIGLDFGSTVSLLAQRLNAYSEKQIFTGSLAAIIELINGPHSVYCSGGYYSDPHMAFQNESKIDLYPDIHLDVSFFGSGGVKNRNGFCTSLLVDAEQKRNLLKKTEKKVVLLDHTKFESTSLVEVATWEEIDLVITNKETPMEFQRNIARKTKLLAV